MMFSVQVSGMNGIINLNAIENIFKRRFARIVLLLLFPIVPVTTIVKSALLSTRVTQVLSKWKKEDSPSAAWLEMKKMEDEKKRLNNSFRQMKMFETNLEAAVQLFVLVTFNLVPRILPDVSHGLGSEFDSEEQSLSSWLLLIGSTTITAFSVINSTISATNLNKAGSLGMKSKLILGVSLTFQLSANLFKNVAITLTSIGTSRALQPAKAGLLLIVSTSAHLVLLITFMPARVTRFQDKLAHLVSNLWMVNPARTMENHKDQVHKSREQTLALLSMLINTTITSVVAATLMEGKGQLTNLNLTASLEFLVVGGGPAIFCHLLGSTFLVILYSSSMWREMDKEEREGKCGFLSRICNQQDPVLAETPSWEEVAQILVSVLFLAPG